MMLACLFFPNPVKAHHGGISLAMGPGSPIETNSPLTLPRGAFVISSRVEHVEWKKRTFAEPTNKDSFTFFNMGLSYGITPFLSGSLFFPYNIKRQDHLGSVKGLGDIKLLLNLGAHYDPQIKGIRLNTDQDTATTLEGAKKTYLSFFAGATLPTGKNRKSLGGEVDPGMQSGFGSPSYTLGFSATRQMIGPLTLAADTSYDIFTRKNRFKFGNEWRANLAGIYELYGKPEGLVSKIDGIFEMNLLYIARDEEGREKQRATGGTILYLSPGLRFSFTRPLNGSLGVMLKFPTLKDLNEKREQQGAEGLEKVRAIMTLSFYF